jgi:mono/diheme cytochrome c family protein
VAELPAATPAAPSASAPAPAEKTPTEQARAVFDQRCASCHTAGANAKAGKHLKLVDGVLVGHHAGTLGKTMRRVLGVGSKATMPPGGPALEEQERQLLVAWAEEQDRSSSKNNSPHPH